MAEKRRGEEFRAEEPAGLTTRDEVAQALAGVRVAAIVADGFEQTELDVPVQALRAAGARVDVLAPSTEKLGHLAGEHHGEETAGTRADRVITEVDAAEYDGLLIPGGCKSPDRMRRSEAHLRLVAAMAKAGKPVAAICHGPWLLADAELLQGRTVASTKAIRRDLERAGAAWRDEEVVVDGNLITSRKPADAPAFARAFVQALAGARKR